MCADFQIFSKTLKIKGLLCENDSLLQVSGTNEHSVLMNIIEDKNKTSDTGI